MAEEEVDVEEEPAESLDEEIASTPEESETE